MRPRLALVLLGLALSAGCSSSSPGSDAGSPDATPTDAGGLDATPTDATPTDAGSLDAAPTDATPTDAAPTDAAPTDAAPTDATPTDGGSPDATPTDGGSPGDAVLDERCELDERVGVVLVNDQGGGQRWVSLTLDDRPTPWFGPPTLADAACAFHRSGWDGTCACDQDEVCDFTNRCVAGPAPVPGLSLEVRGSSGAQTFTGDGASLYGQIDVDGPLALTLTGPGFSLAVPAMEIPGELADLRGDLGGDYDAPTSVDVTWTPTADGHQVTTHININHHVRAPTFTTCAVPAAQGSLHIDGPMLVPLSVVTGLEFQGVEHVRFARATTPHGCVEVRFARQQYVNLE